MARSLGQWWRGAVTRSGTVCLGVCIATVLSSMTVLGAAQASGTPRPSGATSVAAFGERHLMLVTDDRSVQAPRALRAGRLTVELVNRGHEVHIGSLVRLSGGRTAADFERLLRDLPPTAPAWVHDVPFSSFAPLSPGHRVGVAANLRTPGTYVYYCLLSNPTGRPHALDGELTSFRVVGPELTASLPQVDATVIATDTSFRTPVLTAGPQVLRLVNNGHQHHEFAIVRPLGGATLQHVDRWLQGGQTGPAPAIFYGGAQSIGPGGQALVAVDLPAGRYLVVDGETGVRAQLLVR